MADQVTPSTAVSNGATATTADFADANANNASAPVLDRKMSKSAKRRAKLRARKDAEASELASSAQSSKEPVSVDTKNQFYIGTPAATSTTSAPHNASVTAGSLDM